MARVVIVTGGATGIGAATVIRFAEQGDTVILNYHHSREAAMMLAESLRSRGYMVYPCRADVTNRAELEKMVDNVLREFGKIDVLVNNAGVDAVGLFSEMSVDEWNHIVSVNLNGVFHATQAVLPAMLKRHEGSIIHLSSIWGQTGGSCEVAYSATKAALIGMTKALAKELGPNGIRVNCVAPGVINTRMNAHLSLDDMNQLAERTPLSRIGEPDEVASCIVFLASDAASFVTGQVLAPNGGLYI